MHKTPSSTDLAYYKSDSLMSIYVVCEYCRNSLLLNRLRILLLTYNPLLVPFH